MKPVSFDLRVVASDKNINADGWIAVIEVAGEGELLDAELKKLLPAWLAKEFLPLAKKRHFEAKAGVVLAFDAADQSRKSLMCLSSDATMFQALTAVRKSLSAMVFDAGVQHLVIDLTNVQDASSRADAFVSAIAAGLYKFPKYKSKKDDAEKKSKKDQEALQSVTFLVEKNQVKAVDVAAQRALQITVEGTNLVRWLSKRAGNDLDCKTYIHYVRKLAKDRKWDFEHMDHDALTKLKAGGFLSVVQGSKHKDYGIVKVSYSPPKAKKSVAFVGKGIIFDTGGHSLKPSAYMLGMHGDMAGSAVALALLNIATLEQWPLRVTAYLAIADNMLSPEAIKPNDIVTTMKGTTLEMINTDAEGRMVLSDTLYLASKDKPDLIMDFATLTGSCVRAIGTTFSGVFTNRDAWTSDLIDAGRASGERVWPFPMDAEFAECLESTSADLKQCLEKGGVDHIEAAQLLMHFVGKDVPWVHVDLSSIENPGGLGHIASEETGFGVRFASTFVRRHFQL